MGALYVVATPIGNLEDITLRAIAVLSSVDLILCEDTRVTMTLVRRYNIATPLLSYHARSGVKKLDAILGLLKEGKSIALVSDAGTPGISDPGTVLVSAVRKELPELPIVSIPGPSAVISALSIAGIPSSEFLFLGFLPHKKGRQTLLKEVADSKRTTVFYESPHRIMKTLSSLTELLSENRQVVLGRELTKHFEEIIRGTAAEVSAVLTNDANKRKGEFVVLVSPPMQKKAGTQ